MAHVRDDVQMQLGIARDRVPVVLTCSPSETVYCFFRTPYTPREPPAA